MSAPLKSIDGSSDLGVAMSEVGRRARAAARALALAPEEQKNRALGAMATAVRDQTSLILAANAEDVAEARAAGVTGAFLDRLALDPARVEAIAAGIGAVQDLNGHRPAVTINLRVTNGDTRRTPSSAFDSVSRAE